MVVGIHFCHVTYPTVVLHYLTDAPYEIRGYGKQEGQEALNRSPEFCLKLRYRYLLKAGHVPGDIWGWGQFGARCII